MKHNFLIQGVQKNAALGTAVHGGGVNEFSVIANFLLTLFPTDRSFCSFPCLTRKSMRSYTPITHPN